MKNILITGANGFIGSHLCKAFIDDNVNIFAIIHENKNRLEEFNKYSNFKLIACDMDNYKNLSSLLNGEKIDIVYHFAWEGSAGILRGNVYKQLDNIKNSCDLINVAKSLNCKKFIFASSIMGYEVNALMNTEIKPSINTLYSTAKFSADYMLKILANDLGIEYIRAVISNIYGPGELSERLINSSLRKLLKKEHVSFTEGTQLYDFIYIDDAVNLFKILSEKGKNNKTYYIGTKTPKPLREFLMEMKNEIDTDIKLGLGEVSFNGVSLKYDEFNINSIYEDTGYELKYSFRGGIRKTIEWIKENDRFKYKN